MAAHDVMQAPDLPELERHELPPVQTDGELVLLGALIERNTPEPVHARRVRDPQSELRGLVLETRVPPGWSYSTSSCATAACRTSMGAAGRSDTWRFNARSWSASASAKAERVICG